MHFPCVCWCNQPILSSLNLTTTSVLWPAGRLLVTKGLRGLLTLRIIIHFKSWRRLEVRGFTSLVQKANSGLCCCVITSINIYSRFRTTVEWKKETCPDVHVIYTVCSLTDSCQSSYTKQAAWLCVNVIHMLLIIAMTCDRLTFSFSSRGPPLLWRVYLLRTDGVHIRRSTAGTTALSPWTQNGY